MPGGTNGFALPGPPGGSCSAVVYADGGVSLTITVSGGALALSVPNRQGPSAGLACPYFASAAAVEPCQTSTSSSVSVQVVSPSTVELVIPPRTTAPRTSLAGGGNEDLALVTWVPGSDLGPASSGNLGFAAIAECALPQSESSTCNQVLSLAQQAFGQPTVFGY